MIRFKLKNIQQIIKTDDFWPIDFAGNDTKKKQMKVYNFIYRFSVGIFVNGVLALFLNFVVPLLFSTRELPYSLYNFVNLTSSPYFEITYFTCMFNSSILFIYLMGQYFLFFGTLAFVYCQMAMLKVSIQTINMDRMTSIEDEERYFQLFKKYVIYYLKILKYVDETH